MSKLGFFDYLDRIAYAVTRTVWRSLQRNPWVITATIDALGESKTRNERPRPKSVRLCRNGEAVSEASRTQHHRGTVATSLGEEAVELYRNALGSKVPYHELSDIERRFYANDDCAFTGIEIDEYVSNVERAEFEGFPLRDQE